MENIKRACLEIAYDNGMINRYHTQAVVLDGMLRMVLAQFSESEIQEVDYELSLLSKYEFKEGIAGVEVGILSPLADKMLDVAFGE